VKVYLKELVFTENDDNDKAKFKIVENQGANKLDIILGLKLPGVGNIIDSIIKKVRNDVVRYYKANEKTLRVYLEEENKIKEKEKQYNKFLKAYNSYTFVELDKNTLISKIEANKFEAFEFYELFLEDYYLLFIKTNIDKDKKNNNDNEKKEDNIDYISLKKILKLIVQLKNFPDNKDEEPVKNAANIINWVESYSNEIGNILQMFCKLNKRIKNLYGQMEDIINNKKIKYEISERCPKYYPTVNEALFFGIESILKILTSNEDIYLNLINNEKELNNFLNIIREISQRALKMEYNLKLFSKEVYSLREILLIIDCYIAKKKTHIR